MPGSQSTHSRHVCSNNGVDASQPGFVLRKPKVWSLQRLGNVLKPIGAKVYITTTCDAGTLNMQQWEPKGTKIDRLVRPSLYGALAWLRLRVEQYSGGVFFAQTHCSARATSGAYRWSWAARLQDGGPGML